MNQKYEEILAYIQESAKTPKQRITLYAEVVNALKEAFPLMDWVGFYEKDPEKDELYLSAYIGSEACEIIPVGKGVCGKCYREKATQLVEDVHALPYHIACSSFTISEIVVPVIKNGECVAVLDIDSDTPEAFCEEDREYLERIVACL